MAALPPDPSAEPKWDATEEPAAERALNDGSLQGLVAILYENERPPKGLAGLMDWRTRGLFSEAIRRGSMTGKNGECVYVPYRRADRVLHFILVGGGQLSRGSRRGLLPDAALQALGRNLKTLGLDRIGVSKADLGGLSEEVLKTKLGDAPCVFVP